MSNEMSAKPAATRSILVELELKQPPVKVWRALTETHLIETWLMPNDFRPTVGHRFTFRTKPTPGFDGIVHCEVLAVEPPHRLSYSWRGGSPERKGYGALLDTVVTWTLTPNQSGGTLLRLEHDGFTVEQEPTFTMLKKGWIENVTPRLGNVLNGLA